MDNYRTVWLNVGMESECVVTVDEYGHMCASANDHAVIFALPRIAEVVAERFRKEGWAATVHPIPRY